MKSTTVRIHLRTLAILLATALAVLLTIEPALAEDGNWYHGPEHCPGLAPDYHRHANWGPCHSHLPAHHPDIQQPQPPGDGRGGDGRVEPRPHPDPDSYRNQAHLRTCYHPPDGGEPTCQVFTQNPQVNLHQNLHQLATACIASDPTGQPMLDFWYCIIRYTQVFELWDEWPE